MATLYDSRRRAIDADGEPLVGATLTINVANTATPAAIFRDFGLSVPMTNPTSGADVSDAGGWFPQIFAAEGTLVDVTLKDSSGSTIKTEVDVIFLGADTGEFSRTLPNLARLTITDSGGRVLIQAGDVSPDDIGGKLTIEGWAGTQGDELLLDFAAIDTTGRIKEAGKKITGHVATERTAFTAAANVPIALTNDPAGVTLFEVEIWDYSQSGSDDLIIQISYDGGSVYRSTAADYSWVRAIDVLGGSTSGGSASATSIQLMSGTAGAASKPAKFKISIATPNSGNNCTSVDWIGSGVNATENYRVAGMGYGPSALGRATHIRLDTSGSNTMTGLYRVVPVRGTGDA